MNKQNNCFGNNWKKSSYDDTTMGPVSCVRYVTDDNAAYSICLVQPVTKHFPILFSLILLRITWVGSAGTTHSVLQRRILSSRSHRGTQTQVLSSQIGALSTSKVASGHGQESVCA